jgi:cytidine deaminase
LRDTKNQPKLSILSETGLNTLIERARAVRANAHAPYSKYQVGAALRCQTGQVFTGVNVENCAFPSSMCAERTALGAAVSAGCRKFDCIVIVTEADAQGRPATPCGACRQALSEFGLDLRIVLVTPRGGDQIEFILRDLLPGAFRPEIILDGK